jgi:hypothetical protein
MDAIISESMGGLPRNQQEGVCAIGADYYATSLHEAVTFCVRTAHKVSEARKASHRWRLRRPDQLLASSFLR